jgi:hypothetical protein
MASREAFQALVAHALAGPPRQRVHILGGLIDLARAQGGLTGETWRWLLEERRRPLLAAAAARLSGEAPANLLAHLLDGRFRAEVTIPSLILLAPLLADELVGGIAARPGLAAEVITAVLGGLPDEPRQRLAALGADPGRVSSDAGAGSSWWPTTETAQHLDRLAGCLQSLPVDARGEGLRLAVRRGLRALELRAILEDIADEAHRGDREPGLDDDWARAEPGHRAELAPAAHAQMPDGAAAGARPQRVRIGIAHANRPAVSLSDDWTLATRGSYFVWVEIAPELAQDALAAESSPLLAGSELDVVLSGYPAQLAIDPAGRRGAMCLAEAGPARVIRPAARPHRARALLRHRLFFAIRTPLRPGRHALRCNIYHRRLLVESHAIAVEVTRPAEERAGAVQREIDYSLAPGLDLGRLTDHASPRLSILLDDDGALAHGVRFMGEGDLVADAHIDGAALGGLIEQARDGLRRVAWGTAEPRRPGDEARHRYATPLSSEQRADDLFLLARRGHRLWADVLARSGARGSGREALRELMRTPGVVQLALAESARHLFPVALVYDYPLDTGREWLASCDTAAAAMAAGVDLETVPCFAGACPSYGDRTMVCPSGFWGFRHDLGVSGHSPLHSGQVSRVVTRLVTRVNAAGVIGADVTDDEPIAVRFGETVASHFAAGETLGRAVRRARLALLREGNPLGLAYLPFALATLRRTDPA